MVSVKARNSSTIWVTNFLSFLLNYQNNLQSINKKKIVISCDKPTNNTCEPRLPLVGILEISSMLAETENLRLRRSSTAAIIIDDVRWPYFFCHVYVSSETSFFSRRLIGRFGPDGLRSEETYHIVCMYVCVCACVRAHACARMRVCFTFYKSISWAQCNDMCTLIFILIIKPTTCTNFSNVFLE